MAKSKKKIDWEKGEKLYRLGQLSAAEIGRQIGCSTSTVVRHMGNSGIGRDASDNINVKEVLISQSEDEFNREGFVYVIYIDDSSSKRFYKIGMAKTFAPRIMAHQCSSPFCICVACAFFVGNMRATERHLHDKFADKRVRGEWFELSEKDIVEISKMAVLV